MISPYRVTYNTFSSEDFDLICDVAFDSDSGATSSFLSREAVASETYRGTIKHVSNYKYTESFAPVITFIDKNFGEFTMDRQRQILKWITSKDTPSFINIYHDDSNVASYTILGAFISCDSYKISNGRVIGFQCTFESCMPFALSDLYTRTQNVTTQINTTAYYWTSTTVSGTVAPQYLFTDVQEIKVGTEIYSVPNEITNTIIDAPISFYGVISAVNDDGSYRVNDTVFNLTYNGTKTKRIYNNKITINIDTDDNQPVYPRITINHGYSPTSTSVPHTVVPLLPHVTFNNLVDMTDYVENTVYYNDVKNTYYWKTPEPVWRSASTKPSYDGWSTVEVSRAYTEQDTYENNTFYYYSGDSMYYWIDPYSFHSQSTNPNLQTTSVKIINQHYDLFNNPSNTVAMVVKNNTPTEKVILDGANKIISSSSVRRIFGDDFSWNWLELYDGKNEITIEGNCEVILEWREARKIGEY